MTKEINEAFRSFQKAKAPDRPKKKGVIKHPDGSFEGEVYGRDGKPVKVSVPVKESRNERMKAIAAKFEGKPKSKNTFSWTDQVDQAKKELAAKHGRKPEDYDAKPTSKRYVPESLDESHAVYSHDAHVQGRFHHDRFEHHEAKAGEKPDDGDHFNNHSHAAVLHAEASKHFKSARRSYLRNDPDTARRQMERGHHWAVAAEHHVKEHGLNEELNEVSKDKLVAYQAKVAPTLSKVTGRKLAKREKGLEMAKNKYWNSPRVRVGSKEKNHSGE